MLTNPGPTSRGSNPTAPSRAGFSRQAAHSFGPATAEYLVSEGPPAQPQQLLLTRIDNTSGIPVLHSPVPVPVATYPSTNSTPGAPQLGNDNTINTSDTRVLNVVYRNGSVWATHHVVGPSGKVEVAWYRINPGTGAVEAQGRVNDPVRWYYYPSIAVNRTTSRRSDSAALPPMSSSGGITPSSDRRPVARNAVSQLKAGEAPYYKSGSRAAGKPMGRLQRHVGRPDRRHDVLDAPGDDAARNLHRNNSISWIGPDGEPGGEGSTPPVSRPPTGLTATAGTRGPRSHSAWTDESRERSRVPDRTKVACRADVRIPSSRRVGAGMSPSRTTAIGLCGRVRSTTIGWRRYDAGGGAYSMKPVYDHRIALGFLGGRRRRRGMRPLPDPAGRHRTPHRCLSVGILLLPAFALGLRRFILRRKRTASIRPPLC